MRSRLCAGCRRTAERVCMCATRCVVLQAKTLVCVRISLSSPTFALHAILHSPWVLCGFQATYRGAYHKKFVIGRQHNTRLKSCSVAHDMPHMVEMCGCPTISNRPRNAPSILANTCGMGYADSGWGAAGSTSSVFALVLVTFSTSTGFDSGCHSGKFARTISRLKSTCSFFLLCEALVSTACMWGEGDSREPGLPVY